MYSIFFSNDYPVQKQSRYMSLGLTVIFWVVLIICLAVIPVSKPKEKYKTVQIVLSSPEIKQVKKPESVAPNEETGVTSGGAAQQQTEAAEQPVVKQIETKTEVTKTAAVEKTESSKAASTPVKKTEAVTVKEKTSQQPAPKVEYTYATDMTDNICFNSNASNTKKNNFDWSQFDDDPDEPAVNETKTVVGGNSSFDGAAGTATKSPSGVTSSVSKETSESSQANKETSDALSKIAGTSGTTASKTGEGNGSASINTTGGGFTWSDGKSRSMWYPASPDIRISKENSPGMNVDVEITFIVVSQGNVTDINFKQSALLTDSLKNEIKKQISKWQFDAADYTSQATFLLKIRIK